MVTCRVVTAREAISAIEPGSTVVIGEACGEPQTLVEALAADRERLKGSRIVGARYARLHEHFQVVCLHVTPDSRQALKAGKADLLPVKLSEAHRLFQPGGRLPVDVALVQASPPDSQGYCSLGVTAGYTLEAAASARLVIAEVNPLMPRTCGSNRLHRDSFGYMVETDRPVAEYPAAEIGEREMAVAANAAELIDDGAVLSFGVGAIPEAVLRNLGGKRDLGIHSGMINDSMMALIKKGVITNERKNIDKGKAVAALALGTRELFRFINENPAVEMHPFAYTHDIRRIGQLDNFVSVNSALEVDLGGQINAESLGGMQISTIGGQADFARGAALSRGGKGVIALNSVDRDGKRSRIVCQLGTGSAVSMPRYDVQYVVTEYGVADLWGKTLSQRASTLIAIAHPRFRDRLWREWQAK